MNEISEQFEGEIGIIDSDLNILVSTNKSSIGNVQKTSNIENENMKLKVLSQTKPIQYQIYFSGQVADNEVMCDIIYASAKNIYLICNDKFSKEKFLKELILNDSKIEDFEQKCREFKIQEEADRVVFLISAERKLDEATMIILKNIFPNSAKDFVIKLSAKSAAVIKEIRNPETDDSKEISENIFFTLSSEVMIPIKIGIGSKFKNFKETSVSYGDAETALNIGNIFNETENIYDFTKLGLGRLIYQLPKEFCIMFLEEILNGQNMNIFDKETLDTITKFFDNNLNISETSRKLYIHRNTLIYRLDKIEKQIGLDLRNFESSLLFRIAILVNKYLNYHNT
jgi:carbohydrate diacid regulator